MQTIYRERAHGVWEYWTYFDSQRTYLSQSCASKMLRSGDRLVTVQ